MITNTIELNGEDGGGQLLRTALALSLRHGKAFSMRNIRMRRERPGLLRQHLTAVQAATAIGAADVSGADPGSQSIHFVPGKVTAGDYQFSTGTAASTTLVLQTLLPALWACDAPSSLRLEGGTHNPMAPCADFISSSYLPSLRHVGVSVHTELQRHGFYPAGGGVLCAAIEPSSVRAGAVLDERGALLGLDAEAIVSALSASIGKRELAIIGQALGLDESALHLHGIRTPVGPGNALVIRARFEHHTAVFTGHGQRGVTAEAVARRLVGQVRRYLASAAFADDYLADQLLLPMAMAGGGVFTCTGISDHMISNARLIEAFLPVAIVWAQEGVDCWRVRVCG